MEEYANGDALVRKYLELGVGPSRDLDDHVQNGLLRIGIERDVVEGRDGDTVFLEVHAVLQSVGRRHLASAVSHCRILTGHGRLGIWLMG